MVALKKNISDNLFWEVEDYLTDNMVFINGFKDKDETASLGAYGTIISYVNLKEAIDKSKYSKEEWEKCIEYWKSQSYLGPSFTLLALWVERIIS